MRVGVWVQSEHINTKDLRLRAEHNSHASSTEILRTKHFFLKLRNVSLFNWSFRAVSLLSVEIKRILVLFLTQQGRLD